MPPDTPAIEALLNSVKKHPCLWDEDCEDFKSEELQEMAWMVVARENSIEDRKYSLFFKLVTDVEWIFIYYLFY